MARKSRLTNIASTIALTSKKLLVLVGVFRKENGIFESGMFYVVVNSILLCFVQLLFCIRKNDYSGKR